MGPGVTYVQWSTTTTTIITMDTITMVTTITTPTWTRSLSPVCLVTAQEGRGERGVALRERGVVLQKNPLSVFPCIAKFVWLCYHYSLSLLSSHLSLSLSLPSLSGVGHAMGVARWSASSVTHVDNSSATSSSPLLGRRTKTTTWLRGRPCLTS